MKLSMMNGKILRQCRPQPPSTCLSLCPSERLLPKKHLQKDGLTNTPLKVQHIAPEKLPGPNRKGSSSRHHFSGAIYVNFRGAVGLLKVQGDSPRDGSAHGFLTHF